MKLSILYLGHDIAHAAVKARVIGLQNAGHHVLAFAYSRSPLKQSAETGLRSLGEIPNGLPARRLFGLLRAYKTILAAVDARAIDVVYARNLDLALVGLAITMTTARRARFIYEVRDIHPLLASGKLTARVARWVERRILQRCHGLITSSPGFQEQYFGAIQGFSGRSFLMENKIECLTHPPARTNKARRSDDPVNIVYAGKLRCRRSLHILREVAVQAGAKVHIRLAGSPLPELQSAYEQLVALKNVEELGNYSYPHDLAKVYKDMDLNWTIDYQAEFNARTLLPRRLYEGSFFGVLPLTRAETATAARAACWGIGVALSEPIAQNLLELLARPGETLEQARENMRQLPEGRLIVTDDYHRLTRFIVEA